MQFLSSDSGGKRSTVFFVCLVDRGLIGSNPRRERFAGRVGFFATGKKKSREGFSEEGRGGIRNRKILFEWSVTGCFWRGVLAVELR